MISVAANKRSFVSQTEDQVFVLGGRVTESRCTTRMLMCKSENSALTRSSYWAVELFQMHVGRLYAARC